MTTNTMTNANPAPTFDLSGALLDALAGTLYEPVGLCVVCLKLVPLADALRFRCPQCGSIYLPGPTITRERGREMLETLEARRRALGLRVR